jgi:fumarate hydratase class I
MKTAFLELIRKTACTLPSDVAQALSQARDLENEGTPAKSALSDVLKNLDAASCSSRPLCQDTGTNLWYVYLPPSMDKAAVTKDILWATRQAVKMAYLRPNAVDSITGKNSGDNTGPGQPLIHFCEWRKRYLAADLLLKGGGCENVSCQFSMPYRWRDTGVQAGRDLEGVRRVVLEGVYQAEGRGCSPGILGVCVGGDRASGMVAAKEQLFRPLYDENPSPLLDELEKRLEKECNELMIGPMGFGGKTSILGVKIGTLHRLPASFFVSISYLCWAARRMSVEIKGEKFSVGENCVTQSFARLGKMP